MLFRGDQLFVYSDGLPKTVGTVPRTQKRMVGDPRRDEYGRVDGLLEHLGGITAIEEEAKLELLVNREFRLLHGGTSDLLDDTSVVRLEICPNIDASQAKENSRGGTAPGNIPGNTSSSIMDRWSVNHMRAPSVDMKPIALDPQSPSFVLPTLS